MKTTPVAGDIVIQRFDKESARHGVTTSALVEADLIRILDIDRADSVASVPPAPLPT